MANDNLFETNAEQVGEWIEDEAQELEDDVGEMLDDVTEQTLKRARAEVPVDTGALKESLDTDGHSVFSPLEYAPHQGIGTVYMEGTDYLWGPGEEELKRALKELASD